MRPFKHYAPASSCTIRPLIVKRNTCAVHRCVPACQGNTSTGCEAQDACAVTLEPTVQGRETRREAGAFAAHNGQLLPLQCYSNEPWGRPHVQQGPPGGVLSSSPSRVRTQRWRAKVGSRLKWGRGPCGGAAPVTATAPVKVTDRAEWGVAWQQQSQGTTPQPQWMRAEGCARKGVEPSPGREPAILQRSRCANSVTCFKEP